MDRNIIMAVVAVALVAMIFIGLSFFRQPDDCPNDIEIYTERKSYEVGEEVHLSLKSANLPRISTYEWTTEDGQTSNQPSPVFIFDKKSTQQVQVRINEGCAYNYVFEIIDNEEDTAEEIVVTEGGITISKKTAFTGDAIQFNDNSEGASAYWWDFGDANSSPLQNPTHIYKQPGTYTVSRMLNGDEDMVETVQMTIQKRVSPIEKDPNAPIFTIGKTNPRVGEIIQFTDKTPNATSWLWNFGDGYTSQERNPTHVYNFDGNYIVMLSVNGTGKNVNTQTVTISPSLVVADRKIINSGSNLPPPPPPLPPVKMDLATTLKTKFQEIARSDNDQLKTNIYYNDLLPNVADENMPVKVTRNGQQINDTFYDYYTSLNIQGGQRIAIVEVLNTDATGKATALRVVEQ